jgi:hypothetical protein
MKRRTFISIILCFCLVVLSLTGCQSRTRDIHGDPNDPNKVTATVSEHRIDPNVAAKVEGVATVIQVGASAGSGLPVVGPALGGLAGIILAGLTAYRKYGPVLTQYKSDYEQANAVASASVSTIEELKKLSPETWDNLRKTMSAELGKHGIDVAILENVIRGLRGLPPKA